MFEIINNDNKYTIICCEYQYGQHILSVDKNNVRSECERLKKIMEFGKTHNDNHTYCQIEVVNNTTGEIKEYWNSEQNKVLF